MAATPSAGVEALHHLKLTEPPMYLTPSPELANAARIASEHLFASLKPYTSKSPFDRLLVDHKFDAEQIWQQIDLQSQPLISAIRRQVDKFEKDPKQLKNIFKSGESEQHIDEDLGFEKVENDDDVIHDVEDDDDEDDVDNDEDEVDDDDDDVDDEKRGEGGLEDGFFSIEKMKEYMEDDEAKEYGIDVKKNKKSATKAANEFGEEEDDEDDDDDDELFGEGDDDDSEGEDARYEDFFTSNKKRAENKKPIVHKEVEDVEMRDEEETEDSKDEGDQDGDDAVSDDEVKDANLSTHEKQLIEQRAKIEEVERENLAAKSWTMRGEVSATKRPKNSALEVDLDWDRNVNPPPVITEEVSQSIEELIMKRISEGHFDDVERPPSSPSKAPREMKELDENQSKKGLGEIYADEYAVKTGLVSKALTILDEQKKEATEIFKKLCLKLDALSHFHFTPKPIIEDMSIQPNVPALAMEEIAPLAVSDVAMLAPEEVFSGKGDIKEEAELTQADRKRRRANKKRKFKAENANKIVKKARESTISADDGKGEP
uniref:U3 small nucleolar ribonucleoprotein protein MPP10 n=1 Tax=Erigeron canadensis TaxID=72917 RepID=UPI001CB98AAE|nr:U3 small nucleolar ribonucleoprotein protein MPP10 [Erigeron canadensis]